MSNLREELAALEHDQWAHWTAWMLKVLGLDRDPEELLQLIRVDENAGPVHDMYQPAFTREQVAAIMRWRRQIETPYAELTEKEKESDREWADKAITRFWDLLGGERLSVHCPVSSIPLEDLKKLDRE